MRIAQITPGVIPIPPNGWGAVEKIIWEYTKVLTSLGHETQILYTDDVKPGEWDIVHVHMANLALVLRDRGIPYVFSHHDHHAYYFGKDSDVYKKNLEAIQGSVLSFVHAKYLVDFFGNQPQLRYLGHGANINDYSFTDRSSDLLENGAKLIMMAHNGILGDPKFDRKGFIPGVLAAKKLDLPITIICPSNVNEDFFKANSEISSYEKLTVLHDLDYETSLNVMRSHHIFLNPGVLEAGHPNLTVAESISMGIPVVGTMETDLPGQKRVRIVDDKVNADDLCASIQEVLSCYSSYVLDCREQKELLSWEVVVSRMLMEYTTFGGITQKQLILDSYKNTGVSHRRSEGGFYHWFKRHPYFYKSSAPETNSLSIIFKDTKTGSVLNYLCPQQNKRNWVRTTDDPKHYIDWEIVLMDGAEVLESFKMDLTGQHVLIEKGEDDYPIEVLDMFIEKSACIPTLDNGVASNLPHFKRIGSDENFYRIVNTDQIQDFFVVKPKIRNNPLLILQTGALGDTISFLPYANEFARRSGIVCDVVCGFDFLFESLYPNVNIIQFPPDLSSYTSVIACAYKFDLPLQEGFARQLKIPVTTPIRPNVVKSVKPRPFSKKYVCFSMHSTAQSKFWNNKEGWNKLSDMLMKEGLTLVCIDRYFSFGVEGHWNEIPPNCVNKSGMELLDMINWIEHCEFFVGLSSGLSWLAHALGKKVVMISGVTLPDNEFVEDCLRIHRNDICNSCFNFPEKYPFDKGDWLWCPVHAGTARAFECTKKISAKQVMDKIVGCGWINTTKTPI
jgi:autotransporter strand-loop-strand O-heptosyltransferase